MCPAQPQRGPAALRASRTNRRPGCQCTALHRPAAATRTEPRGSKSPRHSSAKRRAREGSLSGRRRVPTRCAPAPLPPGRNVTGARREPKASRRAPARAGPGSEAAVTAPGGVEAARSAPQHPADPPTRGPARPALPHGRPRLPQPRGGRAARGDAERGAAGAAADGTRGPGRSGGGRRPRAVRAADSAERPAPPAALRLPTAPPGGREERGVPREAQQPGGPGATARPADRTRPGEQQKQRPAWAKPPRAQLRNGPPSAAAPPARRAPPGQPGSKRRHGAQLSPAARNSSRLAGPPAIRRRSHHPHPPPHNQRLQKVIQ